MRAFRRALSPLAFTALLIAGWGCAAKAPASSARAIMPSADEAIFAWLRALDLDEKAALLQVDSPAIPRLGIPAYGWWNEALHGLARQGTATVFPQAIGLAASFDPSLLEEIGRAIAEEARLKDRLRRRRAPRDAVDRGQDEGLTFFSPNVNLDRDPRWGRGQETYGEDPLLIGELAVRFVRGMQASTTGEGGAILGAAATAKHFAVHSGPEARRHELDARVSDEDLNDTYLPAFERVVREGQVAMVMAAYNAINGEPVAGSKRWLDGTLRARWGFEGVVVGDCGAVGDLVAGHHAAVDKLHAVALALRAGLDLDCGRWFGSLGEAARRGLVEEGELDRALERLFRLRMRLGLLGQGRASNLASSSSGVVDGEDAFATLLGQHRALARRAALESLVLLENHGGVPLTSAVPRGGHVLVVGPGADDQSVLLGNYHGTPTAPVTLWAGLAAAARARGISIAYAHGCGFARAERGEIARAVTAARAADVVVAVLGLSPRLEGEEGDPDSDNPAGDRRDLGLPRVQRALLAALVATGRPIVLVLTGGSALVYPSGPWLRAALMAWYPGQEGGHAVADALFGAAVPSGRLPVTFYRSAGELPSFDDYRMTGRTYRFFRGVVAWPFGHGISGAITLQLRTTGVAAGPPADGCDEQSCRVTVDNDGKTPTETVVQLYAVAPAAVTGPLGVHEVLAPAAAAANAPARASSAGTLRDLPFATLLGFARVQIAPRERRQVTIGIEAAARERFVTRLRTHLGAVPLLMAVGTSAPSPSWVASQTSATPGPGAPTLAIIPP